MSTPTRSLPASPNLEHLRKQAKDLQRDHQNGRAEALGRIRDFLPKLSGAGLAEVASAVVSRTDAQLVIAREYGFASWPLLAQAVEAPPPPTQSLKSVIEQGDVTAITEMLQQNPHLRDQEFGWTDHKGRQRRITPIRFAHARDQLASFSALRDAGADMRQFNLALWNNAYNLNLPQVKRLLTLGVDPNRGMAVSQTRLGPRRYDVVNALIDAGAEFEDGPRMDIHRGRLDALERRLQKDPSLGHQLFEDSLAGQEPMVHLSGRCTQRPGFSGAPATARGKHRQACTRPRRWLWRPDTDLLHHWACDGLESRSSRGYAGLRNVLGFLRVLVGEGR